MTTSAEDKYQMNLQTWPHQFTRDGKDIQIGEDEYGEKQFAVPMICIHCHAKYTNGQTNRPPDPCPARNQKRELKRILG